MKLIGNLKKQVNKANNKEEAQRLIAKAGMELTMDELEMVAGGNDSQLIPFEENTLPLPPIPSDNMVVHQGHSEMRM